MNNCLYELYNDVFDENGNVKNCGRTKCINLIKLCKIIQCDENYGDMKTGFMQIDKIQALYKKLQTQGE